MARWLAHRSLWPTVDRFRPLANTAIQPVSRWFKDQRDVTFATCRALDVTAHYPDGAEWENPFTDARWTGPEAEQAMAALRALVVVLAQCAYALSKQGALIDPGAIPDLVVIAQLLLLEPERARSPQDLAQELNVLPRGGWARRGQVVLLSDSRSDATGSDIDVLQRDYLNRHGGPVLHLGLAARGRPKGSGSWASAAQFTDAVHQAGRQLHEKGTLPTQSAVAQWLSSEGSYPGCDERALRRWCRQWNLTWADVIQGH